ncbi:AMP-binding protein [Nocardia sp. CA-129566]|uniref:AMP-binding protein n=1 Tax=Nocardia sp. CA-129566 TaxID=3239976 RepID=UPI003D95FF38
MTSGGSTGRPKIMPFPLRWAGNRRMPYRSAGLPDDDKRQNVGAATRLICGNLYHTGNLAPATHVLLTGSAVITMHDFDAAHTVELLHHHSVYSLALAPGHMMAILTLPDLDRNVFRSLARVTHGAAPCPRWVKLGWIDLVGAERLFEIYYSSELSGAGRPIIVNGTEWLAKPGTVGRGEGIRILDENGEDAPPGVIGEIHAAEEFGRAHDYVGTQRLRRADGNGYVSVADLGWLDEDGYLFLVDRMSETIRIDGATVHPGAVEAVIAELPQVADVAVVGLHDERGKPYLHALGCPGRRPRRRPRCQFTNSSSVGPRSGIRCHHHGAEDSSPSVNRSIRPSSSATVIERYCRSYFSVVATTLPRNGSGSRSMHPARKSRIDIAATRSYPPQMLRSSALLKRSRSILSTCNAQLMTRSRVLKDRWGFTS